jgi:hypothetical protein
MFQYCITNKLESHGVGSSENIAGDKTFELRFFRILRGGKTRQKQIQNDTQAIWLYICNTP